MATDCDLLVVGGGPAGLSAAINGASEGLKVCLIDNGSVLGGQARESNAIENYPGFPDGVTGDDLMTRFVTQADKFRTVIHAPLAAAKLCVDGDKRIVMTEDYQEFCSEAVILSLGLNYRRLNALDIGRLMGKGIYYGLPSFVQCTGCTVGVVGGANSAAQAALHLAKSPATTVYMFVRGEIELSMSTYLIDRIKASPNIRLMEHTTVHRVNGEGHLKSVDVLDGEGTVCRVPLTYMFIYIGALPRTLWLDGTVLLCPKKFILTGHVLNNPTRSVMPFETSLPGVFAAGDVRRDSTKRIAAAIGEGSAALAMVHQYMKQLED